MAVSFFASLAAVEGSNIKRLQTAAHKVLFPSTHHYTKSKKKKKKKKKECRQIQLRLFSFHFVRGKQAGRQAVGLWEGGGQHGNFFVQTQKKNGGVWRGSHQLPPPSSSNWNRAERNPCDINCSARGREEMCIAILFFVCNLFEGGWGGGTKKLRYAGWSTICYQISR